MANVFRISLMMDKQGEFFRPLHVVKHLTGRYPEVLLQISFLTNSCYIGPITFRLPVLMENETYAVCSRGSPEGPAIGGVQTIFWNLVFPIWNGDTNRQEFHTTAQNVVDFANLVIDDKQIVRGEKIRQNITGLTDTMFVSSDTHGGLDLCVEYV